MASPGLKAATSNLDAPLRTKSLSIAKLSEFDVKHARS